MKYCLLISLIIIASLVSEFDFQDAKPWGEDTDRAFPDVEAMVRWIDQPSLIPFLKHVAGPGKEGSRGAVVERMMAETHQDDGRCLGTFRRVNLLARK